MDLFSDDHRRNPFAAYDQMRHRTPVCAMPQFNLWMLLDYEGVKRALVDHDTFSSDLSHAPGNGNPGEWFIFFDPPRHTKLRGLISRAITLHGQVIPAGKLVLPMIGSANRDPKQGSQTQ